MSHIVLSLSHLGCRLGLFTAVWRMWFLCRSTFLHVAPVTMKCWLMETVNMREDDTGNVCVCKWESSGAGQPDLSLTSMFAPWSLSCEPSAANQSMVPLFSLLLSPFPLFLFSDSVFFPFPFPTLISPAYSKSSRKVFGKKRIQWCYQTKRVLQPSSASHLVSNSFASTSQLFRFCFFLIQTQANTSHNGEMSLIGLPAYPYHALTPWMESYMAVFTHPRPWHKTTKRPRIWL